MVIRMRIYEAQQADHAAADRVFYERVKPVHEKHGAEFIGRYRDEDNRVVVLWRYTDADHLKEIQTAVAADPDTLKYRDERLKYGLHGCVFQEYMLTSTAPQP